MHNIYRDGRFDPDVWTIVDDDAPFPVQGFALVSKARWLAGGLPQGGNAPVGLVLRAGEDLDGLAEDLHRFPVIALDFPKFSDGRSYSTARLLRERHRFRGEIRAIGDVLLDQIGFMRRCGFDAFAVTHAPSRAALESGAIPEVKLYTQPIADRDEVPAGTRPWLRAAADGARPA